MTPVDDSEEEGAAINLIIPNSANDDDKDIVTFDAVAGNQYEVGAAERRNHRRLCSTTA